MHWETPHLAVPQAPGVVVRRSDAGVRFIEVKRSPFAVESVRCNKVNREGVHPAGSTFELGLTSMGPLSKPS